MYKVRRLRGFYVKQSPTCFICKLCQLPYSNQSNVCRHIREKHFPELQDGHTGFYFNGEEIPVKLISLIRWKVKHGISMLALRDRLFTEGILENEGIVYSPTIMRDIFHSIAEQLCQKSLIEVSHQKIALVADGGTVNRTKWYSIGCSCTVDKDDRSLSIILLEILQAESDSTEDIKNMLRPFLEKLKANGTIICGICTDNAPNISGCFLNTHEMIAFPQSGSDTPALPILRLACSIHTVNLILSDIYAINVEYGEICDIIISIPGLIRHTCKRILDEHNLPYCPKFQPQRWGNTYKIAKYVLKNLDSIKSLFSGINLDESKCNFIVRILRPFKKAITFLEQADSTQSDVYFAIHEMQRQWQDLAKEEEYNNIATQILDLLEDRCRFTLDIRIAEVAYYLSSLGNVEWHKYYGPINIDKDSSDEDYARLIARNEKIEYLEETITSLCSIWNIVDVGDMYINFIDRLNYANCLKKTSKIKFKGLLAKINMIFNNAKDIIDLTNFVSNMNCLPASEAHSERVFAGMNDLIDEKMCSMSEHSLHDEAIMKFNLIAKEGTKDDEEMEMEE